MSTLGVVLINVIGCWQALPRFSLIALFDTLPWLQSPLLVMIRRNSPDSAVIKRVGRTRLTPGTIISPGRVFGSYSISVPAVSDYRHVKVSLHTYVMRSSSAIALCDF